MTGEVQVDYHTMSGCFSFGEMVAIQCWSTQENLEPAITNKNCESLCMPLTIGSHWVVSWTIAALVYNGRVTRYFICTPKRVIRVAICVTTISLYYLLANVPALSCRKAIAT